LCQRNDTGTQHDNNDDSGKRLRRGQGLVPVVPKLKHALASIENAPSPLKIRSVERTASAAKNAMLRFVARVLIARQHDLRRTYIDAATIRTPVYRAKVDYRSPLHAGGGVKISMAEEGAVWGWVCRSAVRSLTPMTAAYGLPRTSPRAPSFSLCCSPTVRRLLVLHEESNPTKRA
jgi:hypothetical protein